ncbi:MAG: hypothetical protein QOJ88_1426 [Pyrinomonadaceae bacterium]|nr:hypothetical protein [Pyrinomonadaceae bacterium]
MTMSLVVGTTLVDADEVATRTRQGDSELQAFAAALNAGASGGEGNDPNRRASFAAGSVTVAEFQATALLPNATPFQPVGIGKPLTLMLRHAYTGRYGKKDMLLTSAVRDPFTTFGLAPRAINLMPKRIPKKAHIKGPAATESGTELVYYIPALTAQALTLTLDMAFDDFPDDLVDKIAGAITTAGGIPVFGPYSGILLAVGAAVKLLSKLANALVDAHAEFSVSDRLEFQVPDSPIPVAGYRVLSTPSLNHADFNFDLEQGLLHKDTGKPYDGDEPYVVFYVDGSKNDSFKEFTPTAASAAQLSKFLSQKEGSEVALGTITDAFKLFSDVRYRREADRLNKEIVKLPAGSAERKKMEESRDAAIANILEELLKP